MKKRKIGFMAVLTLLLSSFVMVVAPTFAHAGANYASQATGTSWYALYSTVSSNSSGIAERGTYCPGIYDPIVGWCYYLSGPSNLQYCEYASQSNGGGIRRHHNPEVWVRYTNGVTEFERCGSEPCDDSSWNWKYWVYYYYLTERSPSSAGHSQLHNFAVTVLPRAHHNG